MACGGCCDWDYQSNLTRRYDGWHSAWDQRFSCDRLDRLYDGEQGPYQGTPNATWEWDDNSTGGPDYLDKVGNWVNFNNTGTLDERNHNAVNEIDSREVSSSSRIIEHDAAGNLHLLQDESGTTGKKFTHDFRNRLIEVEEPTTSPPARRHCRRGRVREVGVHDHQQVIGHAQADRRDHGGGVWHQVVVHDHESVRSRSCTGAAVPRKRGCRRLAPTGYTPACAGGASTVRVLALCS